MELTGNSFNIDHLSNSIYIVKARDQSNSDELTYKDLKN